MPQAVPAPQMPIDTPFPYDGPDALREPVEAALRRVIDPELALTIVDVGLIYGVAIDAAQARVTMTMTSPACPVTDVILDDVHDELARVLPDGMAIDTQLVWEPAWNSDRLSPRARLFMGW
jgi:metal-sulfur cluster biosynthetic enzyme